IPEQPPPFTPNRTPLCGFVCGRRASCALICFAALGVTWMRGSAIDPLLLGDLRVLDGERLVDRLALHPLGDQRGRGDGGPAAERLEPGVLDLAVVADLDLETHDVAAGRRADQAGAHVRVALIQRPDVPRVLVVIQY